MLRLVKSLRTVWALFISLNFSNASMLSERRERERDKLDQTISLILNKF